jgi:hypothetical protein
MPNPPSAQQPLDGGRSDTDRLMFALLREMSGAAQYLRSFAKEALGESSTAQGDVRSERLAKKLSTELRGRLDKIVNESLKAIDDVFKGHVDEHEWCADTIVHLKLWWAQVWDLWPTAQLPFDEARARVEKIDACLDQIIYFCADLVLSPRINDILANLRVGQSLDFEYIFGSELPRSPELRKQLFLGLAQQGSALTNGVVDVENGVIYRAAAARRDQAMSVVRLTLLLALGALLPFALALVPKENGSFQWGHWVQLSSWENFESLLKNFWPLLVNYLLILVGSAAHVAIDALKAAKAQTNPSFQALNDWILWVHVREVKLRWSIGYVILGYVLLSVGMPDLASLSAFFAGYSINSITELFLGRFEAIVKTKTEVLTGQGALRPA